MSSLLPEFRRRVDAVVLSAAGLEGEEQAKFLAAVAQSEATVAAEVICRLREAEGLTESFLQSPATEILLAASEARPEDPPEDPPEGDDRYTVGECLGVGGMAQVYRAFDRQLGRPVALKILRDGRDSGPDTARRLLREARAQARVRHDHVLDVYETGELEGRPYIAVRLAEGGTLEDVAPSFTLEQRVRLIAQASEGLHAAHREGLLHGDVKPSNILLEESEDGVWKAWIGDFGIAVDLASESDRGIAGTPGFLAPERLRRDGGAVDRRADVFALGATLHQVLTGEMPDSGPEGVVDEAALRRRSPHLPADLVAIVCRCLAGDPARRYPSARALAEDLRRFLDGEVVEAHADRRVYRLTRFLARHRALVTLGAISCVLLLVAAGIAGVMGVRAVQANQVADQRRAQAEELIDYTLLDLRDRLDTAGRLDLLDVIGERAMDYFAAVPESELSDDELARRSLALYQIGEVRLRQGKLEAAERPLMESLALARALAARHPEDPQRLFDLGQSEFWVGFASWRRGDLDGAQQHFSTYHDIAVQLTAIDPQRQDWQQELSYAHSNLGSVLQQRRDLEEAREHFEAAIAIDIGLAARAPAEEANARRFELAASHNTLGLLLEEMGRLDEAQEHYEADLALRKTLLKSDPTNQRWRDFLARSQLFLGALLVVRGESEAARGPLEEARALFDELTEHDPSNGDWQYRQALSHLQIGRLESSLGRRDAARREWSTARQILDGLVTPESSHAAWRQLVGSIRLHLAFLAAEGGPIDGVGVREWLEQAREVLEPLSEGGEDPQARVWLAYTLLLRGQCAAVDGHRPAAEADWSRAAALLEPQIAAGTRHHRPLWAWQQTLQLQEREVEAAAVRRVLQDMGVARPFPDPIPCR